MFLILSTLFLGMHFASSAADTKPAASAINALGVDLYRSQAKGDANLLLSPYSIQTALAMTYAGADGDTRVEMQRVLRFPADEGALHGSFESLAGTLEKLAADAKKGIELNVANRLFLQQDYNLNATFTDLVKNRYHAPVELLDFAEFEAARGRINNWVEDRTKKKIRDLIPRGVLDKTTNLVLTNALYLRAPWAEQFPKRATQPRPFYVRGGAAAVVPTMTHQSTCGFAEKAGFRVVTRPYRGGELQFMVLIPDVKDGLRDLESKLTPEWLAGLAGIPAREVILHLPKFRIESPTLQLGNALQGLGMKSAFDVPRGSANFERMAVRKPDDYLYISKVVHKTFLALEEEGIEATAATAVVMNRVFAMPPPKPLPIVVHVNRPFLFAIQHVESGACLFLGRVVDPR